MESVLQTYDFDNSVKIETESEKKITWVRFLLEILQTVVLALILYFVIDRVVARVRVENISMIPTLQPGEFLMVNKFAYQLTEIKRGDIVVFHYPDDPTEDYIKRVVGLPGETIEIHNGEVFINNHLIDESYIQTPPLYIGKWEVPVDTVFVLGDNRNKSSDSHSWGFVPIKNVVGKALIIYWPLNEFKILSVDYSSDTL